MATTHRSDDLIAEARGYLEVVYASMPDPSVARELVESGAVGGGTGVSLVARLADALEAAEARAAEAEAEMHARELHHFEVEQDLAAERAGREVERQMLGNVPVLVAGLEAERDAALAVIEKARACVGDVTEQWKPLVIADALSSVPADVLRERDDRMRGEGWDECYSTAHDGSFAHDPNNPYRAEGFSADMHAIDESEKW